MLQAAEQLETGRCTGAVLNLAGTLLASVVAATVGLVLTT